MVNDEKSASSTILFDGVCNYCIALVQLVIKRDRRRVFRFAALRSEAGIRILEKYNLPTDNLNSFILIENGNSYQKSTASLRVCQKLGGAWGLLCLFYLVPVSIRDFFYDTIVRNRYKILGKRDKCMLPTEDVKSRFIL